jgi:hypothetical protein
MGAWAQAGAMMRVWHFFRNDGTTVTELGI